MKLRIYVIAPVALVTLLAIGLLLGLNSRIPPKEIKFIHLFESHRAEFGELRKMLLQDTELRSVGEWGVRMRNTTNSLSTERLNRYLQLLKQVGAETASRDESENGNPNILLWGWGFAGSSKHLGICWLDAKPTNQVGTLDGYHGPGSYGNRVVAYRQIEANWYLWTDL